MLIYIMVIFPRDSHTGISLISFFRQRRDYLANQNHSDAQTRILYLSNSDCDHNCHNFPIYKNRDFLVGSWYLFLLPQVSHQ